MHSTIISGALILVSTIGYSNLAFAASGDVLEQAVDAWNVQTNVQITEEDHQTIENNYQAQPKLFPEDAAAEQTTHLDEQREARIGDFISVHIDGALVVLSDVLVSEWFAPYIRDIAEKQIVSGYRDAEGHPTGKFGPQDNVTIEQMAKVMVNASGHATSDCLTGSTINLTASGTWSAPFMHCAESQKWAMYEDGSVDAHRNATRAEVVVTLLQAFGKEAVSPATGTGFTDVSVTSQFGAAIEQAKKDGIVSGYTDANGVAKGTFGPEDPVTRAEFAKIVTVGMETYKKKK